MKLRNRIVFFVAICLTAVLTLNTSDSLAQLVTTVAGQAEVIGDQDGDALTQALFNNPHGIAVDMRGRVFIADRWNHKIKVLDTNTGMVTTLAGTGQIGSDNGPGATARFHSPWGVTCDSVGNVYVADTKNQLIRKIDTFGIVTTVAGTGFFGVMDGPSNSARFADPTGITLGKDGSIFVCDHVAHTIRRISTSGTVTTIAGKAFIEGNTDGNGANARFYRPYGIELDFDGNIIVADEWNHRIRKVTPAGVTTTIAGSGLLGSDNGPAGQARFNYPWDVVADRNGVIYVMDGYNQMMRRIANDTVITYAGTVANTGAMDGYGTQASFSGATAIAMDHRNNDIYVGDAFNELIRRVRESTGVELGSIGLQNGDTICQGTTITLTAAPDFYENYEFLEDGNLAQNSGVHTYTTTLFNTGVVEWRVNATSSEGYTVQSKAFKLYVVPRPNPAVTFQVNGNGSGGYIVDFQANAPNAIYWKWIFGDSLSGTANTSFLENPSHEYNAQGTYDITLITSSGGKCMDTLFLPDFVSFLSVVVQEPEDFVVGEDSLCVGDMVSLFANMEGFSKYEFYVNGSLEQNTSSREFGYLFTDAGIHDFYVVGVAGNGQRTTSPEIAIYAAAYPETNPTASLISTSPAGYTYDFSPQGTGARGYIWNFGDPSSGPANISYETSPSHTYKQAGNYDVTLIALGKGGCNDTTVLKDFVLILDIIPTPITQVDDFKEHDTVCTGFEAMFSANSPAFDTYEFSLNNSLVQRSPAMNYTTTFQTPGPYSMKVTGIDGFGNKTSSPDFEFQVAEDPKADARVDNRKVGSGGLSVTFDATSSSAVAFSWNFGDPASGDDNTSVEAIPTHTYRDFGEYDVTLIVSTGGECRDTIRLEKIVRFEDSPSLLFVPSAFTPNGDGVNDQLFLRGQNISSVDFMVFNEWGEMIFRTQDINTGWDGSHRGSLLPPDTYTYVAKVTLLNGQTETLKGQTTVLR